MPNPPSASSTDPASEQPRSIRDYLTAGGNPTALDGWISMAEALDEPTIDGESPLVFFQNLLDGLADSPSDPVLAPLRGRESYREAARLRCFRIIELLSDSALAKRFEQALRAEAFIAYRGRRKNLSERAWALAVRTRSAG